MMHMLFTIYGAAAGILFIATVLMDTIRTQVNTL
jgi:hypothetical protein